MDTFRAVYKILTALEKAMDYPEFDISQIGPDALGVSKERWSRYIEMMSDTSRALWCNTTFWEKRR